jgi:Bacteriophage tail sheath protein
MAVTTSYPGVYIEEFAPAPPIQGVSTSVAAFLGPAASGPILEPTLVTSWDQFKQIFGAQPVAGFYLWYAVRGFFENEGLLAYIVRVSNAAAASLPLFDRSGGPPGPPSTQRTMIVHAKEVGAAGNSITAQVTETQALNNLVAFKHEP